MGQMVHSLVSHVENIGCGPNSDWRIPSSPSPLEGIHWRPPSIGSEISRFQFFLKITLASVWRIGWRCQGWEWREISFTFLENIWEHTFIILGISWDLQYYYQYYYYSITKFPYICHCLHFTNLYQYSPSPCDTEITKPFRQMRKLRLNLVYVNYLDRSGSSKQKLSQN